VKALWPIFFLASMPSIAFGSGGVVCESAHAPDKFLISWGATHGIGSPLFGHINVTYRDQNYALGLEARKTEVGTIALPIKVVGYWIDGGVRIKVTDDQLMRTLVHIEATEPKGEGFVGEAYLQLTEKQASRKMVIKCMVE